jgi:preprotein translocase subunit SecB
MSKETPFPDSIPAAPGESESNPARVGGLPLMIHAQYVKDLSFENPNAPHSLRPAKGNPDMGIDIHLDARRVQSDKIEQFFEVEMTLTVKATAEEGVLFIAELVYCAAVSLTDVPENKQHMMLLVQTPHYMFPFARHILSDIIQKGGFPALLLNPVNFRDMYLQRYGQTESPSGVAPASDAA